MPLLRTTLYGKGIEIYCAPTADVSDVWQASMTHIALEGGCFVLSTNQFCRRKDYPSLPDYFFLVWMMIWHQMLLYVREEVSLFLLQELFWQDQNTKERLSYQPILILEKL